MSRERRVHERVRTRLPARVHLGAETLDGTIENVGEGGVLLATETLEGGIADGDEVEVAFEGRRAGAPVPFRVRGTVLRVDRSFDGTTVVRSLAIRFAAPIDLTGVTWS